MYSIFIGYNIEICTMTKYILELELELPVLDQAFDVTYYQNDTREKTSNKVYRSCQKQ